MSNKEFGMLILGVIFGVAIGIIIAVTAARDTVKIHGNSTVDSYEIVSPGPALTKEVFENMDIGDELLVHDRLSILKVPGGLIYKTIHNAYTSTTFVPLD